MHNNLGMVGTALIVVFISFALVCCCVGLFEIGISIFLVCGWGGAALICCAIIIVGFILLGIAVGTE